MTRQEIFRVDYALSTAEVRAAIVCWLNDRNHLVAPNARCELLEDGSAIITSLYPNDKPKT